MNKFLLTSVALAVAAVCGSASAATVEISGKIDMGLNYTVKRTTGAKKPKDNGSEKVFQLISGQNSTSSWQLKGSENLANGWKVGFKLDSGFEADDGTLKGERLFQREALIWLTTPYGEIGMGRCGVLDSGNGRYGLLDDDVTPYGTGWEDIGDSRTVFLGQHTRTDNVITYASPKFSGVQLYAQASTKMENVEDEKNYWDLGSESVEGSSDANRYYGIGAKYEGGPVTAVATVSRVDISKKIQAAQGDDGDSTTVTVAGAYDFGSWKLMAGAQYFDSGFGWKNYEVDVGDDEQKMKGWLNGKGYGVFVGTQAKVLGGKLYGMLGYADGETVGAYKDGNVKIGDDINIYQVALGYEYKLSKRTHVYCAGGYNKGEYGDQYKTQLTQFMAGLVTKF